MYELGADSMQSLTPHVGSALAVQWLALLAFLPRARVPSLTRGLRPCKL